MRSGKYFMLIVVLVLALHVLAECAGPHTETAVRVEEPSLKEGSKYGQPEHMRMVVDASGRALPGAPLEGHIIERPTLRQWLQRGDNHIAMAPVVDSTLIHMSVLTVLEQNALMGDKAAVSLSGCSTAGQVAAAWATRSSKHPNEYVKLFGSNLPKDVCAKNCTDVERFYTNYLKGPSMSVVSNIKAIESRHIVRKYGRDFGRPFKTKPSWRESTLSWVHPLFWIDLFKIPEHFEAVAKPVVISGLHGHKDTELIEIFMNRGNMHIALLGTASPPGNTQSVPVHEAYQITDGYYGDYHGAAGYDVLPISRMPNRARPRQILNIIIEDKIFQVLSMNWSLLEHHSDLAETTTLFLSLGSPMAYQNAFIMRERGLKHLKSRHIVSAIHTMTNERLDKPMDLTDMMDMSSKVKSYSMNINLHEQFPHLTPRTLTGAQDMASKAFSNWRMHSEDQGIHPKIFKAIRAKDSSAMLQNPDLLARAKAFQQAANEMYSGPAFKSSHLKF